MDEEDEQVEQEVDKEVDKGLGGGVPIYALIVGVVMVANS